MKFKQLTLQHIGPFIEAEIFATDDAGHVAPIVLITGENGTGKSIILDAIRGMFGQDFATLDRDLRRRDAIEQAQVSLALEIGNQDVKFQSEQFLSKKSDFYIFPTPTILEEMPVEVRLVGAPNWIVDYWPSNLAIGTYRINSLENPQHEDFLKKALQGQRFKVNVTQLICHFDYLRDSQDPTERATGERLYTLLQTIIADSLLDGGYLSHVARATYTPIIVQNGQAVPLENLSGGNAYLIQNMVSLLGKMHAVHHLNKTPPETLHETPGLLLIDEAENQLHPKWQKRLIHTIRKIFPNLQIIATTHSPFIIASAPEARLFVCQARGDHCIVADETARYSHKPVDEILMSPLFEATRPFNTEISALLEAREQAIRAGDAGQRAAIEQQLHALNPTYFAYFELERMLADLNAGS